MSAKKSGSSAKKSEPETFDTREVVLGKIRGFPPWPGMVVDPASVPKAVSKERPANKKSTVYAIRFFPAGDYAWLPPKELTRLTSEAITAFVQDSSKKGGELMEGYRKALDPVAWEQEHAANPPAAKKRGKSKSKAKKRDEGDEEDELDADEPAEDEAEDEAEADDEEKPDKKRKRSASPSPAKSKAKAKAAKAPAKNGKKGGKAKKSKAAVESEDDAGEEAEADGEEGGEEGEPRASKKPKVDSASALESDPEALKVREWRHKLQKTFLSSNKSLPKEEEMPAVDTLFTTVEGYQNMNIDYLTFSKIGKVMRHINLLEAHKVPRDDEFKFRDRAKALVDKWHQILNANKAPEGDGATAEADGEGATVNGAAEGDLTVMDTTMDES